MPFFGHALSVDRLVCPRNAQQRDARGVAHRCVALADLACDAGRALLAPGRSDSSDHLPGSTIGCHTSRLAAPRSRLARSWRYTHREGNRRSQLWERILGRLRASRSS